MIAGAPSSAPNRRRRMASPCSLKAARVFVAFDIVQLPLRLSFQPDTGVGNDLLPDLGLAGDVSGRLVLRAGDRLHALLGVGGAYLGGVERFREDRIQC